MPRIRRKPTLIAVGAIIIAVVIAVLAWPRSGATDTASAQAERLRQMFTAAAAPTKGVSSTILTPAGDSWWETVTGLSGSLRLPNDQPPSGAQWYAGTTSEAYHPSTASFRLYHSVYVQFATDAQAAAYHPGLGADACECVRYVRGNLVTLTDVWVDPTTEPFRALADGLHLQAPTVGTWDVNLALLSSQIVSTSPYPKALQTWFTKIGFNGKTLTWHATSPTAAGPWTGTLDGWSNPTIDLPGAASALAGTVKVSCDAKGTVCDTLSQGLNQLDEVTYLADPTVTWGTTDLEPTNADPSAALTGAFDPNRWQGLADMTDSVEHTDLDKISFTISGDGRMSVQLALAQQ